MRGSEATRTETRNRRLFRFGLITHYSSGHCVNLYITQHRFNNSSNLFTLDLNAL